jgi:hypothetical protein
MVNTKVGGVDEIKMKLACAVKNILNKEGELMLAFFIIWLYALPPVSDPSR